MARYDVFLANALADREQAELVVRRLRALKFKVRYDKKREHTTPTPRDYRDADNSGAVLVLWSEHACDTDSRDSDWIHAIAHHARSRDEVLVQAALDASVPDEPFSEDQRFDLRGLAPRKLVDGIYDLVEHLGARDGRMDLRDWMTLKASDKDGKEVWKENHPTDPIALAGKLKTAKPAAPAPKAESLKSAPPIAAAGLEKILDAPPSASPNLPEDRLGTLMLASVGVVVVAMLMLSAGLRSDVIAPPPIDANGVRLVEQCPAGRIPAYLLSPPVRAPLEPGPIIDDTEDE